MNANIQDDLAMGVALLLRMYACSRAGYAVHTGN